MSTQVVPTRSFHEQLRERSQRAYALKWMGDETQEHQYSGHFYVFEPGVPTHIPDRMDYARGKKGTLLVDEPMVVSSGVDPDKRGPSGLAENIIGTLLEESRLGGRGLCVLFGDEGDAERERVARRLYLDWEVQVARQVQNEWLGTCEKAMKAPGALPPVQPPRVRAKIAWLKRYEAGLIDRAAFICRLDGFESNDRNEVLRHIRETYGQEAENAGGAEKLVIDRDQVKPLSAEAVVDVPSAAPAPALAPPAPVPAPTLPATDHSWVLAKATELGVNLTKADYVGLLTSDQAVIESIAERLAEAAIGKEKKGGNRAGKR